METNVPQCALKLDVEKMKRCRYVFEQFSSGDTSFTRVIVPATLYVGEQRNTPSGERFLYKYNLMVHFRFSFTLPGNTRDYKKVRRLSL